MKKYNRIKVVLAEKERTTIDLASKIGKSRTVVSNYVNNNSQPSIQTLFEIAKELEVSPCDLLSKDV